MHAFHVLERLEDPSLKVTLMPMLTRRLYRGKHATPAITQMPCSAAARSRCQCPKAAGSSRGRSVATSIDSDEHSGTLKSVMAAVHSGIRIRCQIRGQCVART